MQGIGPHVLTIDLSSYVTKLLVDGAIHGARNVTTAPIHLTHRLVVAHLVRIGERLGKVNKWQRGGEKTVGNRGSRNMINDKAY